MTLGDLLQNVCWQPLLQIAHVGDRQLQDGGDIQSLAHKRQQLPETDAALSELKSTMTTTNS